MRSQISFLPFLNPLLLGWSPAANSCSRDGGAVFLFSISVVLLALPAANTDVGKEGICLTLKLSVCLTVESVFLGLIFRSPGLIPLVHIVRAHIFPWWIIPELWLRPLRHSLALNKNVAPIFRCPTLRQATLFLNIDTQTHTHCQLWHTHSKDLSKTKVVPYITWKRRYIYVLCHVQKTRVDCHLLRQPACLLAIQVHAVFHFSQLILTWVFVAHRVTSSTSDGRSVDLLCGFSR